MLRITRCFLLIALASAALGANVMGPIELQRRVLNQGTKLDDELSVN